MRASRAPAAFKDLCIDAADPRRMASFWAAALGLEVAEADDQGARLAGPTPQHTVWVNGVPEPVTVKQRVHLDLNVGTVEELVTLGARVVDAGSFRWTVLKDPEGGDLCAFVRERPPAYRLYEVVLDTGPRPGDLAQWWADVLGGKRGDDPSGYSFVTDVPGLPCEGLCFVPVPEPKTVKNRVHLDLTSGDIAGLVGRGATLLRTPDAEIAWHVLADPEGNEFCVFPPEH